MVLLINFILILTLLIIWFINNNFKFRLQHIEGIYHNIHDNYMLLFVKPENLSKSELVEKFKELSSTKSLEGLSN